MSQRRRPRIVQYAIALLSAAIAAAGNWLLIPSTGLQAPFAAFYLAIVVSSWYGGLWPGVITTILCTAAVLLSTGSFEISGFPSIHPVHIALFIAVGLAISLLNEALRRVRARAESIARAAEKHEKQLRESEARFRMAADAVNCMIYDLDLATARAERTRGITDILGYTLEEADPSFDWWESVIHPDDRESVRRVAAQAIAEKACYETEYRARHKDGHYVHLWDRGFMMCDDAGHPLHAIGCAFDVTARKRIEEERDELLARAQAEIAERELVEQALRESEARYRNLMEEAADGIYITDAQSVIHEVNARACEILGYSREELLGTRFSDLIDPSDLAMVPMRTGRVLDGEIVTGSRRVRRKNGSYITLEGSARKFAGGLIQNIVRDATERIQTEEALRQAEARLRHIMGANIIGIIFGELDGPLFDANDTFMRMIGYSREEILSPDFIWATLTPPEYREVTAQAIEMLLATGICPPYEKEYRRKDGTHLPVLVGLALLDREQRHCVAFILDMTERKKVELELQRAMETADAANQAKDQFLAVLSHELRTPLTPVLSLVQAIESERELPPDLQSAFEIIRRNVELEARLIDDLLDITRISRGKLQLTTETVDAHELLHTAIEICSDDFLGKHLLVDIVMGATEHVVTADPARLQQIFWNLIKNAAKFTPDGGRISIRTRNSDPGRLTIEVTDTGIGIEPEILPRIFNAFEQGEQTITRRFGGLGLGLAVTKALVEMHGGTLTASSAGLNRGATFRVGLAAHRHVDVEEPTVTPRIEPRPARMNIHILLVEDHPDTSNVMKLLLERSGFTVTTAHTMRAGIAAAEAARFDLLISDIGLPDGSGLELMREINRTQSIKAIALSGFGMEDDVRKSIEVGFAEHLTKPISHQRLIEAIEKLTS